MVSCDGDIFWTGALAALIRTPLTALEMRTNKPLQTPKILHNQSLASALDRMPLIVRPGWPKNTQNSNEQTIERGNFFS
jgi:hypothetical protein